MCMIMIKNDNDDDNDDNVDDKDGTGDDEFPIFSVIFSNIQVLRNRSRILVGFP